MTLIWGETREQMLERKLRQAEAKLEEQHEVLQALAEQAKPIVQVVGVKSDHVVITNGSQQMRVNRPPNGSPKVGDLAYLVGQSGQITETFTPDTPVGIVATVKAVFDGRIELDAPGGGAVVVCDRPVQPGNRVVVDRGYNVVLDILGPPETTQRFKLEQKVRWEDVGGNEGAKRALREAIEVPYKHPEIYAAYGKRPTKGVLLYGPPGCGKTLLAKAAATALADVHGAGGEAGFIYVKGPELLSKWVGQSEAQVRELFSTAREHKKKHGFPALIFIDEADAILGSRNAGRDVSFALSSTLVPQFLTEMDGLEDSGAMILLATNRPDALDSAIVRDGRVDHKVKVERPNIDETASIFHIYLKSKPIHKCSLDKLIESAALDVFAEHRVIAEPKLRDGRTVKVTVGDLVSGALVASVVEQATAFAMMRDVKKSAKKPSGIGPHDIEQAIDQIQAGMIHLDHTEVVMDKLKGD